MLFFLCNFQMGQWHAADEYDGQVREITFRSLCTSPMCPPDTAMTEYQHAVLSPDKKTLVCLLALASYLILINVLFIHYMLTCIVELFNSLSFCFWPTFCSLCWILVLPFSSFLRLPRSWVNVPPPCRCSRLSSRHMMFLLDPTLRFYMLF